MFYAANLHRTICKLTIYHYTLPISLERFQELNFTLSQKLVRFEDGDLLLPSETVYKWRAHARRRFKILHLIWGLDRVGPVRSIPSKLNKKVDQEKTRGCGEIYVKNCLLSEEILKLTTIASGRKIDLDMFPSRLKPLSNTSNYMSLKYKLIILNNSLFLFLNFPQDATLGQNWACCKWCIMLPVMQQLGD